MSTKQPSISSEMKGRSREMEEKRINKELGHIRQKFKDGNLSGYDRKKYICKLLYIYILGYPIDFGHVEAANLLNSSKFKEKHIGYLAVTLLFNENSDTIHLVINSFKKDLDVDSDLVNSLVLSAIANIGGSVFADTLGQDVYKMLTQSTSSSFVKKKAALCLLKLYRRSPGSFDLQQWPGRLSSLITFSDLGVATAASSLIMALCSNDPSSWVVVVPKCIEKLSQIVLQRIFEPSDTYYKVPAPWLQIKLLRILQLFEIPSASAHIDVMTRVLQSIVNSVAEQPKGQQYANALHAIFFEAVRLAYHWQLSPTSSFFLESSKILIRFLTAKDLNARYLTLDTLSLMLNSCIKLPILFDQQDAIISACNDRDISIRQQALDVLYRMATNENGPKIVSELLNILKSTDAAMKEVLVLRIAILTEKFAPSFDWYFRTMFQVIVEASTFASDDVCYRIVQRFSALPSSNNVQDLMLMVFNHVESTACPEKLLQLCVYLIGERGDVLCNMHQHPITPGYIFEKIHQHFGISTNATKSIMITTYLKLFNLFPELSPLFKAVLASNIQDLDVEIQERTWEYSVLLQEPDTVLATACEQMPPYSGHASELESRLAEREQKKHTATKTANTGYAPDQQFEKIKNNTTNTDNNLLNLRDNLINTNNSPIFLLKDPSALAFFTGPSGGSSGVLFSDKTIEIGAIVDYSGKGGNGSVNIFVYFGNRTTQAFEGLSVNIETPSGVTKKVSSVSKNVGAGQQERLGVVCTFHDATHEPIIMRVRYCPSPESPTKITEHLICLPAWVFYFGEPIHANLDQFMSQWTRCEKFSHSSKVNDANNPMSPEWLRSILQKLKWGVVSNAECDSLVVCAAAKFTLALPAEPMFALIQVMFSTNMKECNIEVRSFPKGVLAVAITKVLEFLVGHK